MTQVVQLSDGVQAAAVYYVRTLNWALIPIKPNDKAGYPQWNKPENWITTPDKAKYSFGTVKGFGNADAKHRGVALLHAASNTCAIDIDDYTEAALLFSELGFDLSELLKSTAHFNRGNNNRAKAIFTFPLDRDCTDLAKLVVKKNGKVVVEFRCGTNYDVLPPSTHPSGDKFEWVDNSLVSPGVIEIPSPILDLWFNPAQFERSGFTAGGGKKKQTADDKFTPSPLDAMVLEVYGSVEDLIDSSPYHERVGNRWKPTDSTHAPGLSVFSNGKIYSGHASDPIYHGGQNTPLTPFEFYAYAHHWPDGATKQDALVNAQLAIRAEVEARNSGTVTTEPVDKVEHKITDVLWVPPREVYSDDPSSWPLPLAFRSISRVMMVEPTEVNIERILTQHPAFQGVFYYDEFTKNEYTKNPPWEHTNGVEVYQPHHAGTACAWLQRDPRYTLVRRGMFERGIEQLIPTIWSCDTLKNSLLLLPEWDRQPRIATWLIDYCRASDTPVNREFGRRFLIGLVARAMRPGCKLDTMLILEGAQGIGKSRLADVIAGGLHLDCERRLCQAIHMDLSSHDAAAMESLQGIWLAELGELSSFRKSDRELLKNFLSRTSDHFRTKYTKNASTKPRRMAWIGTTNETEYLDDITGARRYWPVSVPSIDTHRVERDRAQLLAEALYEFNKGAAWWIVEDEVEGVVEAQRARAVTNPMLEPLRDILKASISAIMLAERKDGLRWINSHSRIKVFSPVANHGVFLTSEQIYLAGNLNRSDRTLRQILGPWIRNELGWADGFGRSGSSNNQRAVAPSIAWLDENIPDWRKTYIGRKISAET